MTSTSWYLSYIDRCSQPRLFVTHSANTFLVHSISFSISNQTLFCRSQLRIYFEESAEQDQSTQLCSLILLCTLHCFIISLCQRNFIQCLFTLYCPKEGDSGKSFFEKEKMLISSIFSTKYCMRMPTLGCGVFERR